jgi:hypothetical protein
VEYPKRDPHFAIRYLHAVNDAEIVQRVGHSAALLVQLIALREDRLRYSEPPKFWRAELMRYLAIKNPNSFQAIRDRAAEAGLLHIERGTKRQVTKYWVLIPDWMRHRFPNEPVDILSRSLTPIGVTEAPNQDSISIASDTNGQANSIASDTNQADDSANSITISITNSITSDTHSIPIPIKERTSCPDPAGRDVDSSKSQKRKARFTDADMETAKWIERWVQDLTGQKERSLDKWANEIRLMRERDGRSDEEIRDMFGWANNHEFWAANILCPKTLRQKWPKLMAQRRRQAAVKSSKPAEVELESL